MAGCGRRPVRMSAAQRLAWRYKFQECDVSGDGKLDVSEMAALLRQGNPGITDREVSLLFKQVDRNSDGSVDFDEFVDFLYDMSTRYVAAPLELRAKVEEHFGPQIEREAFLRLCGEAKLYSVLFQHADAEAMFDRQRARGRQTIDFGGLDMILSRIAEQKKVRPADVHEQVMKAKFRAPCGDSCVSRGRARLRPCGATLPRESSMQSRPSSKSSGTSGRPRSGSPTSTRAADFADAAEDEESWDEVEATYQAFCKAGQLMTGPEFTRLCDESLIFMDHRVKRAEGDVVFSTFMNSQKKLEFHGFKKALRALSCKKEIPVRVLRQKVALTKQPRPVGTEFKEVAHLSDSKTYRRKRGAAPAFDIGEEESWYWVKTAFDALDAIGGLDGVQFRRLCQDCGWIDHGFPQADADILFSSCARQKRAINFAEFQGLLREVARRKGAKIADIQRIAGYRSGLRL